MIVVSSIVLLVTSSFKSIINNKKYALSTQCIGLGMGIATVIESVN